MTRLSSVRDVREYIYGVNIGGVNDIYDINDIDGVNDFSAVIIQQFKIVNLYQIGKEINLLPKYCVNDVICLTIQYCSSVSNKTRMCYSRIITLSSTMLLFN